MQRNVRSEIAVALTAVLLLAFVFAFAIFLSNTSQTQIMTGETALVNVATQDSRTETMTFTEIPNRLDGVTQTAVETTRLLTLDITPTNRVEGTITPTNVSNTGSDATKSTPSNPTQRAMVATSQPTVTARIVTIVSATPRASATSTATKRPTLTATTPAPVATDTRQPSATPTESAAPVPTDASDGMNVTSAVPMPTATDNFCTQPFGWVTYHVQSGNTLFAIAQATGSSVQELRRVNCIADADTIVTGQVLFVPNAPMGAVRTIVPAPSLIQGVLYPIGCTSPLVYIASPVPMQRVTGIFSLIGTATYPKFWYYKIEVRPHDSTTYQFYLDSFVHVTDGLIGQVNPALFGNGVFWVRVSVVDETGAIQSDAFCEIPIVFD